MTVISRRSFIGSGIAVAALSGCARSGAGAGRGALAAIVPVMLAGALATDPAVRAQQIAAATRGFDAAVAGLPPLVQAELGQLFALLANPLTRFLATGIAGPLENASPASIERALNGWRFSPIPKLRAAYDALHQLIFAAWYGQPMSWAAIRYPGPPSPAGR